MNKSLRLIGLLVFSAALGGLTLGAPTLVLRAVALALLISLHLVMFYQELRRANAQTKAVFFEALHQLATPTGDQKQAAEILVCILLSLGRDRVSFSQVEYNKARNFTLIKEFDLHAEAWVFRIERTAATANGRGRSE